ncbi:MAG TPA: SGNH/GDSL hydrolase family protein [Thermoanaerobaculia bacterium]|nr:SGNH/GDSL hydrolase family protein [Thermoanaerobaculia bacterium]
MKNTMRLATAVLIAVLVAVPMSGGRGTADFTNLVTLGDSYGAGVESGSMNERHQVWSWPAVLARQVGLNLCPANAAAADPCFSQPLVSFPGIGPELQLVNLAPTIAPAQGQGTPLMLNYGRFYNNLSIPGATVGALLAITGQETPQAGEPTAVTFGRFILRGLDGPAVDQAVAQRPTFVALWIGGNDFLGSVLAGTDQGLTSAADFKARYELLLDKLIAGAPNAGMVVGNLPTNPLSAPIVATIPPFIVNPATRQPVLGPDGNPIFYIADLGGGNFGQLPPGSAVLLTAQPRLATGFGFPNVPPFNALPNAGKPLPASDVITPAEMANIIARITEYNATINAAASARNIPVADIKGLFDRVTVNPFTGVGGMQLGPIRVTSSYITGGFFSLDGFHLTDLGYLLFANEYIKAINAEYDTEIPLAGIAQLYSNNGAFFPETTDGQAVVDATGFVFTGAAAHQVLTMWALPTLTTLPAPVRRVRGVRH